MVRQGTAVICAPSAGIRRLLLHLGLVFVALLPGAAQADPCIDYGDHVHWSAVLPSDIDSWLCMVGQYLYASGNTGVSIWDVADATTPALVCTVPTPGLVAGMEYRDGRVYMTGTHFLRIYDAMDPTAPTLLGEVPYGNHDVAVSPPWACVAGDWGFHVVDVSDPAHPVVTGSIPESQFAFYPWGIDVSGSIACVVDLIGQNLYVIEISAGGGASIRAEYPTNTIPFDVVIVDPYAIMVCDAGLLVIDISNPSSPVEIGIYHPPAGLLADLVRDGDIGYAASTVGLQRWDLSDPSAPVYEWTLQRSGTMWSVAAGSGAAALTERLDGIRVADVANPDLAPPPSQVATLDRALGVAAFASHLAVADGQAGLATFELGDPSQPQLVGHLETSGSAQAIAIRQGLACVADSSAGISVVDVTNPEAPVLLGSADTPGTAVGVRIGEGRAYVADLAAGIAIVDLQSPSSPTLLGTLDLPGDVRAVDLRFPHLLAAASGSGLYAVDVSDPSQPSIEGSISADGPALDIRVAGSLAYVATTDAVTVVDISALPAMEIVGTLPAIDTNSRLVVDDEICYVLSPTAGLCVIDVSHPSSPSYVGGRPISSPPRGLAITGDRLFVATGSGGLQVLPAQCQETSAVAPAPRPGCALSLRPFVPNPMHAATDVVLDLGVSGWVRIELLDVTGRKLREFDGWYRQPGAHRIPVRIEERSADPLSSGSYWLRVSVGGECATGRIAVVR